MTPMKLLDPRCWGVAALAAAVALGAAAAPLHAESVVAFYKKKGLRMIVGSGAGGGYDTYTRTMTRHMERYMPGKAKIIVQNMPGASGIRATNYIYNSAPRDGSVMMATYQALMDENLLGNRKAKFDIKKMTMIGNVAKTHHLCVTWHTSPIKTLKEAVGKKLNVSATGRAGNSATVPLLLNQTIGTKFHVIAGYSTTGTRLALERGEVDAICGLGLSTLQASNPDWFTNHRINIIGQIGLHRIKQLPNVVNAIELAPAKYKPVYEFFGVGQELGRPYLGPPGMPADKVRALRDAFNATMKDKGFLADMKKQHLSVDPMTGEEMEKLLDRLYAFPQSTLNLAAQIQGVAKKERVAACKKFAKDPSICRKKKKKKRKKRS